MHSRPTPIKLNLDEIYDYPFKIGTSSFHGSFNNREVPLGGICVSNKLQDVILKLFNMIKRIN